MREPPSAAGASGKSYFEMTERMGTLIDQLCAACDASFYQGPPGQSLLLFILALIGGSRVIDPEVRLDPYLATVAHVQITLERVVHGSRVSESFLVVGLIRAIEDVLEDCSQEAAPERASEWYFATRRLLRQGVLIDSDGGLSVVGEIGAPALDRARHMRADLDMWHELTAPILAEQNLEHTIHDEVESEDS